MTPKRLLWLIPLSAAVAGLFLLFPQAGRNQPLAMPESASFRVLLGINDTDPVRWDGSVSVQGGTVLSIQGWRFADDDSTDFRSSWKLSTRRAPLPGAQKKGGKKDGKKGGPGPLADNGVIITSALQNPGATFTIDTPQGRFSFQASELPYGEAKTVLNGRVRIERVPSTVQLITSAEEQDHPVMAQTNDDVWLAYVDFTHGDRSQEQPFQLRTEPKSFDFLARPAGGDQIKVMRYSKSNRTWTPAEAVSPPGQDAMRAAIAVDGQQRVWVIWSANRDSNFDLYAKSYAGGRWSSETRLTSNPGQDLNPVAATDSAGRVWLAWQAYRNNNLEVLAATSEGDRFGSEQRVSFSPANDWDPTIAGGPNGEIAIAWDTYDKGDYDVYVRRMKHAGAIRMQPPVPVAATPNFEARPSIAIDANNRIWIAYEASDVKWGKDFGAYETTGIGLYQGHNLQVRVLHAEGLATTANDVTEALPGGRSDPRRRRAQQQAASPVQPNPDLAKNRPPSATPQPPPLPKNSFPRLTVDSTGNVFLAYRMGTTTRSPIGPIWLEQVAYFDGKQWQGPIEIPHSDGFLDIRPALVSPAPGQLMMVVTTDHRQAVSTGGRFTDETLNTDLYAMEITVGAKPEAPQLKSLSVDRPASPDAEVAAEREQIRVMRNYRADVRGAKYRLVRGEFHRHTELSADGGMVDGPIIDAYRYMLDAAAMDWGGCCDHDNGRREYYWWIAQKLTDAYNLPGKYTAMFSYERSVRYPEGHRNTVMAKRGIRPLPRLPIVDEDAAFAPAPDTQMLYRYLRHFDGIVASHTSGTGMGTDWRNNDPILEPVVEIYQGDRQNYEMPGAPRSNNENDSIGGWRPLGFVSNALQKGYRLGFQASSDHVSTHMSYCNLWVTEPTRSAVMDAFKKRRVYGATDNILADVRCGSHFMGEEFDVGEPPVLRVKLVGTADFKRVDIIKDNQNVYSAEPKKKSVDLTWRDDSATKGKTSYYYIRGEQVDGEIVWVSPMWITYR